MAHVLAFHAEAWIRAMCQKDIDQDFDKWLTERAVLVAEWGTLYPGPHYSDSTGVLTPATPPAVPPMPLEGPARDSRDCLRLIHHHSEAEWEEVKKLHQKVWERKLEEDRQRVNEAPPPPPPQGGCPGRVFPEFQGRPDLYFKKQEEMARQKAEEARLKRKRLPQWWPFRRAATNRTLTPTLPETVAAPTSQPGGGFADARPRSGPSPPMFTSIQIFPRA